MASSDAVARPGSPLAQAVRFDFTGKLGFFPQKVGSALREDPIGALSVVYLDVNTDICNHRCTFCDGYYRSLKAGSIPTDRLVDLVGEMEELGVLAVVLAGDRGEPMVHPGIGRLLERLADSPIEVGIYTNGTRMPTDVAEQLRNVAWVRISADAGSARVHRAMHVYPARRNDFEVLLGNLGLLGELVPEVGVSFIIDPLNLDEIELAADVLLGAGAHFIEYKPKYLPDYTVDCAWLDANGPEIGRAIGAAGAKWGRRVVANNQISGLIGSADAATLLREPRQCLTSLMRLVVSTHGCYPCTPYRGESERRFGNILTQSLREVLTSAERLRLVHKDCSRICAYNAQNDFLLDLRASRRQLPTAPHDPQPQDRFL